jgi:hypothetical protein
MTDTNPGPCKLWHLVNILGIYTCALCIKVISSFHFISFVFQANAADQVPQPRVHRLSTSSSRDQSPAGESPDRLRAVVKRTLTGRLGSFRTSPTKNPMDVDTQSEAGSYTSFRERYAQLSKNSQREIQFNSNIYLTSVHYILILDNIREKHYWHNVRTSVSNMRGLGFKPCQGQVF